MKQNKSREDVTDPREWPLKEFFWVEIEDHSEDGSWSGYAHSDAWADGYRATEAKQAVLKSVFDKLRAELEDLLTQYQCKFEERERLAKENAELQAELEMERKARQIAQETVVLLSRKQT